MAGTYDGRCIFYETEVTIVLTLQNPCSNPLPPPLQHLKYHTQIQVRSRHGKNKGRKISGVEPLPGEDKVRKGRGSGAPPGGG